MAVGARTHCLAASDAEDQPLPAPLHVVERAPRLVAGKFLRRKKKKRKQEKKTFIAMLQTTLIITTLHAGHANRPARGRSASRSLKA
jgi:hypothetical protein